MSINPTPEQIAKLPKWAQDHIRNIDLERDSAAAVAKKLVDHQTQSPIYVDDWLSNPRVKRYVRCEHSNVVIEHAGVRAEVLLARKDDGKRLFGIEVTYSAANRRLCSESVALMPRGSGSIQLVHKDHL